MPTLVRCLRDNRWAWKLWILTTLAGTTTVPLVILLPLVQQRLIDDVLLAGRRDLLVSTVAIYGTIWFAIALIQVFGTPLRAYLDERLLLHLRTRLFAHCQSLSVPLWHREHGGRILALFSNDAPAIAGFLGSTLVVAAINVCVILVGAVVMFRLNSTLAIVMMLVPPSVAILAGYPTRPLRRLSRRVQDTSSGVTEFLHESMAGLRETAAFGREHTQADRLHSDLSHLQSQRMRLAFAGAVISAGQSVFSLVVQIVLLGLGGYFVVTGRTTLGTVLAIQMIFNQVYPSATSIVATVIGAQRMLASADRLYEFLDVQPEVRDATNARRIGSVAGQVRFENVSFSYNDERHVLKNVTFTAAQHEVIALVGPSGAGKTTITSLIARFYDPQSGAILLDGVDLRELSLHDLRNQISIVFQDPFLFASTIRENIAFGQEGVSEQDIISAAISANAWEFIERLPDGLDTVVGQRAVQLSEGQKQRVAIARALVRDPRILILDEPTASLDARSEHLIQEGLETLMRGRTTFVVAHRLSTIRRADRILVIQQGMLVEQGTHAELVEHLGLYRELYQLQTQDSLPDAFGADRLEPALAARP